MTTPKDLVLLPGLLCDAALWAHQAAALADIARPVVADLTGQDSVAGLAESVLAAAPERFALAALSMGGYVAFEIVRRAPERVTALALMDTSARPDSEEQSEVRRGLIALSRRGRFKGVTPRLLPRLIHPDRLDRPEPAGTIIVMAERTGQQAFIRQQTAIMGRPDSRPGLGAIACPTLVAVGRQDALTPPELAAEMATGIPGARLEIIEASGHLPPLEQPEATAALMRAWLEAA